MFVIYARAHDVNIQCVVDIYGEDREKGRGITQLNRRCAMKPKARILDATAGNRSIWKTKESSYVIWIDIEKELEFKPDRFLDCTQTDFPNNYFHTIVFDPPHLFGVKKNTTIFSTPSKERSDKNWPQHKRRYPRYYGSDKYKTKTDLLNFVYRSQKEFYRIIMCGGLLWIKWNECIISFNEVLALFKNWNFMMIHYGIPPQQISKTNTFWAAFMKQENWTYTDLSQFTNKRDEK